VRVEPASALELLPPRQGASGYAFRTAKKASRVTVRSTVDDTAVSMRVIGREEIKDASLSCNGCQVLERGSIWVFAHTTFGDAPPRRTPAQAPASRARRLASPRASCSAPRHGCS